MFSDPVFSIIVPVHNTRQYLRECVESIKAQTFSNFECLLVDDGSSDGSSDLCDVISKEDCRFRVIHITNGGVSRARNIGIEAAKGKYVTFADRDDSLCPIALASYLQAFNINTDIDIVRGGYTPLINSELQQPITLSHDIIFTDKADLFNTLEKSRYYSFVWSMCVKRQLLESIHFDETINWLEDHLFSYQCYLQAKSVYVSAKAVYNYNIRTSGQSLSRVQDPKVVSKAMDLEYELKNSLNQNKYPEGTEQIELNYRRNVHRIVCLAYYGNYTFKYRKELSQKSLQINDGLFREDRLFFCSRLPFIARDIAIRLLLKIKGSFAPYE